MTQPLGTASAPRKPKLRWFQFSIGTLLIGMLLVSCGLGWLGWLMHDVREQATVVKFIEQHGEVEFGAPNFLGRMRVVRSLLGEHAFAPIKSVTLRSGVTDAHLLQFLQHKKLKELQSLSLIGIPVSDLSPLAGLTELTNLDLARTQVKDLSPLAGLNRLTEVRLGGAPVSDLSPLAGLSRLTWLDLARTRVSNLSPLSGLSGMTRLDLDGTPVSDLSPLAGLSALRLLYLDDTPVSDLSPLAGLPNLQVVFLGKNQRVQVPESLTKAVQRK